MYTTAFELTKNKPPHRRPGLGGAPASLRTLLSPMRALPALALAATTMLALGRQSAHGANWLPADDATPKVQNAAVNSSVSATWEGTYFADAHDITDLTTPGPNGYNTMEWRYYITLRANGAAQFLAQRYYNYYPGYGTQNFLEYHYGVWGPGETARWSWSPNGANFYITGAGYIGLQDSGKPVRNYQYNFPTETITFTLKWLSGYSGLQLTEVSHHGIFPTYEGNTWTFRKIAN